MEARGDARTPVRAVRATVVHPTVSRLAEGTALLRRIVADRPALVADALLGGATPEQVAQAVGLDLIELRAAVSRWATRQRQDGLLTTQAYTGPAGPRVRSRRLMTPAGRAGGNPLSPCRAGRSQRLGRRGGDHH